MHCYEKNSTDSDGESRRKPRREPLPRSCGTEPPKKEPAKEKFFTDGRHDDGRQHRDENPDGTVRPSDEGSPSAEADSIEDDLQPHPTDSKDQPESDSEQEVCPRRRKAKVLYKGALPPSVTPQKHGGHQGNENNKVSERFPEGRWKVDQNHEIKEDDERDGCTEACSGKNQPRPVAEKNFCCAHHAANLPQADNLRFSPLAQNSEAAIRIVESLMYGGILQREKRSLELRDYVRILRRGWAFILVFSVLGVAGAVGYSVIQTRQYVANTKVIVSISSGSGTGDMAQASALAGQRAVTYANLVSTATVLDSVISQLSLSVTVSDLASQIQAVIVPGTSIISVTVTDSDAQRSADIANATARSLTSSVSQIEPIPLAASSSSVRISTIQPAVVPGSPDSPNLRTNLIAGGLLGLTLGLIIATMRGVSNTRIRDESELQTATTLPILGRILQNSSSKKRPLVVQANPQGIHAEAYRTLRANIQFLHADRSEKSFVITSSLEGEGKSTTIANIAIAMAETGANVLLVEADMRSPNLTRYLGLDSGNGLSDVLIGRAELTETIQRWGKSSLYTLSAGQIPPNPSELLGSRKMSDLISQMNKTFDIVLFDSPPVLPVADALVLTKAVGGVIVIVAIGKAHRNHVAATLSRLTQTGVPISGIVLTQVPVSSSGVSRYGYGASYADAQSLDATWSVPTRDASPDDRRGTRARA